MVWSSDAVARYTLSGDHAISDKPFVCPFKLRISSPENGDHILATLSAAFRKEKKVHELSRASNAREAGDKGTRDQEGRYRRRLATFRQG